MHTLRVFEAEFFCVLKDWAGLAKIVQVNLQSSELKCGPDSQCQTGRCERRRKGTRYVRNDRRYTCALYGFIFFVCSQIGQWAREDCPFDGTNDRIRAMSGLTPAFA
jgi:hypothetical protein